MPSWFLQNIVNILIFWGFRLGNILMFKLFLWLIMFHRCWNCEHRVIGIEYQWILNWNLFLWISVYLETPFEGKLVSVFHIWLDFFRLIQCWQPNQKIYLHTIFITTYYLGIYWGRFILLLRNIFQILICAINCSHCVCSLLAIQQFYVSCLVDEYMVCIFHIPPFCLHNFVAKFQKFFLIKTIGYSFPDHRVYVCEYIIIIYFEWKYIEYNVYILILPESKSYILIYHTFLDLLVHGTTWEVRVQIEHLTFGLYWNLSRYF